VHSDKHAASAVLMRKAPCPCMRACVRVHVRIGGEPEGEGGEETEPWVLNLAPTVLHNCVIRALVPARQMFPFLAEDKPLPQRKTIRHVTHHPTMCASWHSCSDAADVTRVC
jgi:hypothetical protein